VSRTGLCRGAPSEEDVYLAAGAPGYGESAVEKRVWVPSQVEGIAASAMDDSQTTKVSPELRLGQLVRVSSGYVPKKSMQLFLLQWTKLVLPVYSSRVQGCMSARLLVGEKEGTNENGSRAGMNSVVVITEWSTPDALAAAIKCQEYTSAMQQIVGCFQGPPEVRTYGQEAKYSWVGGKSEIEKSPSEHLPLLYYF